MAEENESIRELFVVNNSRSILMVKLIKSDEPLVEIGGLKGFDNEDHVAILWPNQTLPVVGSNDSAISEGCKFKIPLMYKVFSSDDVKDYSNFELNFTYSSSGKSKVVVINQNEEGPDKILCDKEDSVRCFSLKNEGANAADFTICYKKSGGDWNSVALGKIKQGDTKVWDCVEDGGLPDGTIVQVELSIDGSDGFKAEKTSLDCAEDGDLPNGTDNQTKISIKSEKFLVCRDSNKQACYVGNIIDKDDKFIKLSYENLVEKSDEDLDNLPEDVPSEESEVNLNDSVRYFVANHKGPNSAKLIIHYKKPGEDWKSVTSKKFNEKTTKTWDCVGEIEVENDGLPEGTIVQAELSIDGGDGIKAKEMFRVARDSYKVACYAGDQAMKSFTLSTYEDIRPVRYFAAKNKGAFLAKLIVHYKKPREPWNSVTSKIFALGKTKTWDCVGEIEKENGGLPDGTIVLAELFVVWGSDVEAKEIFQVRKDSNKQACYVAKGTTLQNSFNLLSYEDK